MRPFRPSRPFRPVLFLLCMDLFVNQSVSGQASTAPRLWNWNWTYQTTYGVSVSAKSIKQVRDIVANPKTYPSPVLAVGNMHSVTQIMTNPSGTIVNLLSFNKVLSLDTVRNTVTVQAGITLADLHDYLADKGWEMSFMPEIGDATVGSLCVTTSKDSSIQGPGYLSALIQTLTYVDHNAKLVTLKKGTAAMDLFTGSWGVAGIVIKVTFEIRPLTIVTTSIKLLKLNPASSSDDLKVAQSLLTFKKQADNLFITTDITSGWVFVEARSKCAVPQDCQAALNSATNRLYLDLIRNIKYTAILTATVPATLLSSVASSTQPITVTHYRRTFVNRYPKVTQTDKRLDFSYFEFQDSDNLDLFVEVYTSALQFVRDFYKQTSFRPGGLGTYFVTRPGTKKTGQYRGVAGTSFMLDPGTGSPDDPNWIQFLVKFTDFVYDKKTALFSLSQTKLMTRAQLQGQKGLISRSLAQKRFTTPFLAQFVGTNTNGGTNSTNGGTNSTSGTNSN